MVRSFKRNIPDLTQAAFVASSANIIGAVSLEKESSIWYLVALRADLAPIIIGKRSNVQDGSVLHVTEDFPVFIGDDVTIGHGAIIHGSIIGNRCLIGMGTTILDGVFLEGDILVAAGSLLPPGKRYPAGSLVMGSPAKVVRRLSADELAMLPKHAAEYVALAQEHQKVQLAGI